MGNMAQKMDVRFRLAAVDDLEDICSLVDDAIRAMEQRGIYQWDDLYPVRDNFVEDIEKQQLYVGMLGKRIAVIYALNHDFDAEYENGNWKYKRESFLVLHRLCVSPEFWDKGVGKKTLLYIEEQLKDMGIFAVRLDVFGENSYAIRLYNKLGYERVGFADWRKGRFYLLEKKLEG